MKLHRINAIILHHLYFWRKSLPRWLDIAYWPTFTIIVWGFIAHFLKSDAVGAPQIAASFFLGGITLWMLFQRAQQDLSISYLQDIWSRSIVNLYVSPLTNLEFIIASIAIGIIKVLITLIIMAALALWLYAENIFALGPALIPFIAMLLIFGWSIGLFATGIIFRYGTDAQIIAFSISFLLQPFTAVFYPLSILPSWLQPLAQALPITHVFEGMRALMTTGVFSLESLAWSFGLNILYLIASAWFFVKMFNSVKRKGLLAKLE